MIAKDRYEVILAGSGGQGLVLCGVMLGEAAVAEGRNAVQTASYGIASRGGFSRAEVIIDREEIVFQQVRRPDLVLALTAGALEAYGGLTGVPVFYDCTLFSRPAAPALYGYPFTRWARELGRPAAANIIALGVLAATTGLVRVQSLAQVVARRFAGPAAEPNIRALYHGAAQAEGVEG